MLATYRLILLPGSPGTKKSLEALAAVAGLDSYTARLRLNKKLPVVLEGRAYSESEIVGSIGDALASSGIRFCAVESKLLATPFQEFRVRLCSFGDQSIRCEDAGGAALDIDLSEPTLLVCGRYQRQTELETVRRLSKGRKVADRRVDSETNQFIHLYVNDKESPFSFIDWEIDYRFLGVSLEASSAFNFPKLADRLEIASGANVDRSMMDYGFSIEDIVQRDAVSSEGRECRRERVHSNEESSHRMSRLLHLCWCVERSRYPRIWPAIGKSMK